MTEERKVEIYYKPTCPFCNKALALLRMKKGIHLEEINVEDNPELKAVMVERSSGRATVPQIFIYGEHIGGCDELMELEKNHLLESKLYPTLKPKL